ncbi:MAG: toll/interleukin-1 receptor domain-containing protein [Cyanobacteria bacterium P01_F01_bin.86]
MTGDRLNVFISYSRKDEALKNELARHLKILHREGKINTWQDRDIEAGTEWATAIKTQLENAEIILLLVTSNFLASDYCYETEMQRAVQRHHEGTARVIPIILKPCGWQYSDFKDLQALPQDGEPVPVGPIARKPFSILKWGFVRSLIRSTPSNAIANKKL